MSEALHLITGSSKGIGLATAQAMLQRGASVLGLARSCPEELESQDGYRHWSCDLSLGVETDAELAKQAKAWFQGGGQVPDTLILNAGVGVFGTLEQLEVQQVRSMLELNLMSVVSLAKLFLPRMKERGWGKVIVVGSEASHRPGREGSAYAASKFALRGLAGSLREECARSGIGVSMVLPGMVRSNFYEGQYFEPGPEKEHALSVEEVARAILYVCDAPVEAVVDEVRVSPLQHVVAKKRNRE